MSFDTPNGTRGARQPKAGLLMRWFNGWSMNRIRRKGGKVMGMDALVLTTVGRKSGVERSSPVAYFPEGNDAWLIVASANGAANNPAWYHNLAAIPTKSELRWPVARLPSVPNSSTDRRANRHGDVSRTIYRVSRSTSSRPTASFRSFVCKPAQHPVPSTPPLLSSVLRAIRLCPPDHMDAGRSALAIVGFL